MSARAEAIITAGLRPELFSQAGALFGSRTLLVTALTALVLVGFGFRVSGLSAEGLSEDELNKLYAVSDYRAHGLTGANGEHPMLMKSLQTASIVLAEKWNSSSFVSSPASDLYIQPEAALRLPGVIFGAFTAILIYLVAAELFGPEVAFIAAALWAFDPNAIGFNRIAKEDTFLLFFFLLANVFWLRGQRIAESRPEQKPSRYYWATGAAYGAMMASKYVPHLIAISVSYYWIFQNLPETRWRLGKERMLLFFGIIGVTFIVLSPTILLPETWHQMGLFAGQKRLGHDGYEFMGQLYRHRWSDWLRGTPWYFYLVFTWVKLPLLTLIGLIAGLPLLFKRKLGDGRYFIFFWLFFFFLGFSVLGGKFTRYYTVVLPAVLITAALGVQFAGHWLAQRLKSGPAGGGLAAYAQATLVVVVVLGSVISSIGATPHFRLYLNSVGGGVGRAGYYFPHDEFYDTSMREAVAEIAPHARPGAHIVSESPALAGYYATRANRGDLVCESLSDPVALTQLSAGDFVIAARGRRYFSNDGLLTALHQATSPLLRISVGSVHSVDVYQLDPATLQIVRESSTRLPVLVSTGNMVPAPVN
ncbi:MAG TPA: glycosyltransferase family 39 protein [Pyrinomonadaceae bacterium]|nr:glycosyltransferase family 39 protein [Pyrinomonadaceae bacterium]